MANNSNLINSDFDSQMQDLKLYLEEILAYTVQICHISNAFITFIKDGEHTIIAKTGLENLENPMDIKQYSNLIKNNLNKKFVFEKAISKTLKTGNHYNFNFFDGFPLQTNGSFVQCGMLCILHKEGKILSKNEELILKKTIVQIEHYLNLFNKFNKLSDLISHKENQFQLFLQNSNEIFYHLDLKGNFIYVAESWTHLLGHDIQEIVGTNFSPLIHPEDVESCFLFLDNLQNNKAVSNEHTYRIKTSRGEYIWQTSTITLIESKIGPIFSGAGRDITKYVEDEQKIKKQKIFYEKILDGLPIGLAVYDKDLRYQYLNKEAIKNDELRNFAIGKTNFEYEAHVGRDQTIALQRQLKFDLAILKKQTIHWEDTIYNKNGEVFHSKRTISPIYGKDGQLEMLIGFGQDITENKNFQEELLKNKKLLSSVLENVAVGILVQGPDSEILENNLAACEMLGLTQDQLIGKSSFDKDWRVTDFAGQTLRSEDHPVPRAIKELKSVNGVVMGVKRSKKSDIVWLLVDAVPVFDNMNKLLYVVCSFNDISERKNIADKLNESLERFRLATKATSDIVWDWNLINNQVYISDAYTSVFGHVVSDNTLMLHEIENKIHPDDKNNHRVKLSNSLESSDLNWNDTYRLQNIDQTYRTIKDKGIFIRDENGKAIRMIGAMQDISSEIELQNLLKQSEKKFKDAFDYSAIGMALVDKNGYWIEVNDSLIKILGYTKDEFRKLTVYEITHPDDLAEDLRYKEKLLSGELSNFNMEKRYFHKNKSPVWVHLFVTLVKDKNNDVLCYIPQILDITEKKKTEEINKLLVNEINRNKLFQLNEAKNKYKILAENTVDLVCTHDLNGFFQYVSPSIRFILGYYPYEIIGLSPLDFAHPEDAEKLSRNIISFVSGEQIMSTKIRLRHKNNSYIWFEIKAKLVFENKVLTGFHTSTRDITESIEAKFAIEKTLKQERELNELRTNLVSTISHEFRTPMTTIRSSAELIMLYLENQNIENAALVEKRVNTITSEIDRIVNLMNRVLIISKNDLGKTNFRPTEFDLKTTCMDAIELSDFNKINGKELVTSFNGEHFPIFADKNLMEYILINLLNNAYKYSKKSKLAPSLSVEINDNKINIKIKDHGIGIPDDDQSKLFNTFFRASNTNGIEGTGLGLYIVKTFTEKNSGSIKLESKLGVGTTVTLFFPLHKNK